MPFVTDPRTGQPQYIPGVYSATYVDSDRAGPLPGYHVPVLLAGASSGHPYNADELIEADEASPGPFRFLATSGAVGAYYGQDSDMAVAMRWAKKHGMPGVFCCSLSALTRGSVMVTSAGPIVEFKLAPKRFGAVWNHIMIKATLGTSLQVKLPKQHSLLTADVAAGAKRLYVRDNSWLQEGSSYTLADNVTANETFTVLRKGSTKDSSGQAVHWIETSAATVGAFNTATYGMVLAYDETGVLDSGVLADAQAQIDWINSQTGGAMIATAQPTFSNAAAMIAVPAFTALKSLGGTWGAVTLGTSPEPTSSDVDAFIAAMDGTDWDSFGLRYQVLPQSFYLADPSSTAHAAMRDWSAAKRAEGLPVSIMTGVEWGDHVLGAGDDTDPLYRCRALNSQDVALAVGGLDGLAAYLSFGPAVWGLRVAGGNLHNLTNDDLVYTDVERRWDERTAGEVTSLLRAGALIYHLKANSRGIRYRVAQGLSTLQANAVAWNTGTNDTAMLMQRDLADFIEYTTQADLDALQIGADAVDPNTIAAGLRRRALQFQRKGLIVADSWGINSITENASGAGYDVDQRYALPKTNDYITVANRIKT